MNNSFQHFSRSLSLGASKSRTSILKDPSKSKLKHNRSVRFLDPESSSDESVEQKSICQQQIKETLSPGSNSFINYHLKFLKREPPVPKHTPTFIKKKEETKTLKIEKPVEKKSQKKGSNLSPSPKVDQKSLNFEFRNKAFYAKLNKFISSKEEKQVKTESKHKGDLI